MFEQNNVVSVDEGTGGVTEAFKNRFLVFNDGTQAWLEHVVTHEFTHVVQFNVLYNGFWKSIRLIKSILYPLWFMEGMPEYTSGNIDQVQGEMVVRDAVTSNTYLPLTELHGFNHVKPHQVTVAYKIGEAAIDYIAREYGRDKVGLLLSNMAERFDMNSTLLETIGISLADLDKKLHESLEEKYADETANLKEPEFFGTSLTHSDGIYPAFNVLPAFFPDGGKIAYISDLEGFNEIFVYDLALSRSLPLNIQKKFPGKLESIHQNGSALSISPDGRYILFAGAHEQHDYLYLYDLKRNKLKRLAYPLDSVYSPQFSPDGQQIAFIGMKEGISDVYISHSDGRGLKQLTDTFADENDLRFFPDGKTLLFSRETGEGTTLRDYERDLWSLSLETGKETRLTSLPGDETQPAIAPSGKEIVFVGNATGINNLYRMDYPNGQPVQMTQVIGGNFSPVYSPDGQDLFFVSYRKGEEQLYKGIPDHS